MTAVAALALISVGGLVTSHGVGMSVPDWPNTYGYNMFAFPVSQWIGGILYEHSHRLVGTLVGLMTVVLAAWIWASETEGRKRWAGALVGLIVVVLLGLRLMPVYVTLAAVALVAIVGCLWQAAQNPDSTRWLGMAAVAGVVLQGVLGGLRVVWARDYIGIFHATLAQLFMVLVAVIALRTSKWWARQQPLRCPLVGAPVISPLILVTTAVILAQLVLGATMRHQHAGLAIPDFPLAYGKVWPEMSADAVARYNQHRIETVALNPITSFQILLQMVHRILAAVIAGGVGLTAWSALRRLPVGSVLRRAAAFWLGLIVLQVALGAWTIWSNKAADIATLHVVVGALSMVTGSLMYVISRRFLMGSVSRSYAGQARIPGDAGMATT